MNCDFLVVGDGWALPDHSAAFPHKPHLYTLSPFPRESCSGFVGGPWPPGVGLLLHSCVEEMEEGGAVLASVEAHTQLGEVVLIEGSLNGL